MNPLVRLKNIGDPICRDFIVSDYQFTTVSHSYDRELAELPFTLESILAVYQENNSHATDAASKIVERILLAWIAQNSEVCYEPRCYYGMKAKENATCKSPNKKRRVSAKSADSIFRVNNRTYIAEFKSHPDLSDPYFRSRLDRAIAQIYATDFILNLSRPSSRTSLLPIAVTDGNEFQPIDLQGESSHELFQSLLTKQIEPTQRQYIKMQIAQFHLVAKDLNVTGSKSFTTASEDIKEALLFSNHRKKRVKSNLLFQYDSTSVKT